MTDTQRLGPPEAKIWIINNSPKKSDTKGPMTSRTSAEVVSKLNKYGVRLRDIRYDYLIPKVTGNKGVSSYPPDYVEQEIESLRNRIALHKPNLVFGLGADVLEKLFGQKDVSKWRGHIMWSDRLGCKVLFSYDPFTAYRQRSHGKAGKPGQFDVLLKNDIRKAANECRFSDMQHSKFELKPNPTFSEVKHYLIDAIENANIISYDIEVPRPYEGRLMDCIGLCTDLGYAICIPFYIINPENKIIRYFKHEAEHLEVLGLIKQLMESRIPKVAQNSQFDTTMLEKYYGIKVNNLVWDTMVAAHNIYCDLPKDLGTLISIYTNLPYHKYLIHSSSSMDRWEYNAADAVANLHIMVGQIREMCNYHDFCDDCSGRDDPEECVQCPMVNKSARGAHYWKVSNPSIENCVKMHIAGIRIDLELRDKVIKFESEYMEQIRWALSQVITKPLHTNTKDIYNVNPKSPKQMGILFYDLFSCKPVYNNGKQTANKDAMKEFMRDSRHYVSILAKACRSYVKADSTMGKFKVEPDGGYVRTQYDVAGTDTGRLASKKSDVMKAGNNYQNVEKGDQRRAMIPEAGEEFCLVDLYAAEAYLNASDADELDMLKMISGLDEKDIRMLGDIRVMSSDCAEAYKIHNWMLRQVHEYLDRRIETLECNHVTPADELMIEDLKAAKAQYDYKKAKQSIHALNYNVQPGKASAESGLPIAICQWQNTMYHGKFPGIQMRMRRLESQLRATRILSTLLGRHRCFIMDYGQKMYNKAYAWPSQSTIGEITNVAINYLHYISDLHEAGRVEFPLCRPLLNVHDGIAIRTIKGTRDHVIPFVLRAFNITLASRGVKMRIPVSIAWGDNFNDSYGEDVYFYPLEFKS